MGGDYMGEGYMGGGQQQKVEIKSHFKFLNSFKAFKSSKSKLSKCTVFLSHNKVKELYVNQKLSRFFL